MTNQSKIPTLKKKISSFLTKEDGKISKDALIRAGMVSAIIAGMASGVISEEGKEDVTYTCKDAHITPEDCQLPVDPCEENKAWYFSGRSSLTTTFKPETGEIFGTHAHHSDHCSHASHSSHGSHGSHGNSFW